jgi:hypothetical protein
MNELIGSEVFLIAHKKVFTTSPAGMRYVFNGKDRVLQVGHAWKQGEAIGVEWTDVPTVDVNGAPLP